MEKQEEEKEEIQAGDPSLSEDDDEYAGDADSDEIFCDYRFVCNPATRVIKLKDELCKGFNNEKALIVAISLLILFGIIITGIHLNLNTTEITKNSGMNMTFTEFEEFQNAEVKWNKTCDSYKDEYDLRIAMSVVAFGLIAVQMFFYTLPCIRMNLREQRKDNISWVRNFCKRLFCSSSQDDQNVSLNWVDSKRLILDTLSVKYKGFCSTIRRYVSPSIILEIISQIFDLTYLDIPFLHRWYGQSNIQESKYLIKGNLFYGLFYISISVEFIIIFISMLSKKGKCINAKYVYLLLGPLPVLNILEYFYRLVCL